MLRMTKITNVWPCEECGVHLRFSRKRRGVQVTGGALLLLSGLYAVIEHTHWLLLIPAIIGLICVSFLDGVEVAPKGN